MLQHLKSVKYGVFAVSKDVLGADNIFDSNGEKTEGVVSAEIQDRDLVAFVIRIIGFGETQMDVKLAMGAYVEVTIGDKTEYAYLQINEPRENEKYFFASYNDIISD